MAWCRQETSHYLSQCWCRSMASYSIAWPKWVKSNDCNLTDICISKLTIIGSDNGLASTINWTNAGILLIRPLETNFSEILIKIHIFSFKKIHLNMASGKWRPFCLGINELTVVLLSVTMVLVLSGQRCETNINECDSNPCIHGSCIDRIGRYDCNCNVPYSGRNCEIELNPCEPDRCLNDAQCMPSRNYTDFQCQVRRSAVCTIFFFF